MSDTPETDAKASQDIGFFSCATVPADFARKLERERDEAREEIDSLKKGEHLLFSQRKLGEAIRERDEARDDLEFRRELYRVQENYLELARRERDEAREQNAKLREIAKRAIKLLTTPPALFVFPTLEIHNEEHGKQLRAALDQLTEGMR